MKHTKQVIFGLSILTLIGVGFFFGPVVKADTEVTLDDIQTAEVTLQKAGEMALKEAGSGKIAAIDFSNEEGQLQYEVTILDRTTEKEYTIDAGTGKILASSREKLSKKDREEKMIAKSSPRIDLYELEKLLAGKYPDAKIIEFDLEIKRGSLVYDVTLVNREQVIDVRVNATSGKISKEKVTSRLAGEEDD